MKAASIKRPLSCSHCPFPPTTVNCSFIYAFTFSCFVYQIYFSNQKPLFGRFLFFFPLLSITLTHSLSLLFITYPSFPLSTDQFALMSHAFLSLFIYKKKTFAFRLFIHCIFEERSYQKES